jgi:hypothetical protein
MAPNTYPVEFLDMSSAGTAGEPANIWEEVMNEVYAGRGTSIMLLEHRRQALAGRATASRFRIRAGGLAGVVALVVIGWSAGWPVEPADSTRADEAPAPSLFVPEPVSPAAAPMAPSPDPETWTVELSPLPVNVLEDGPAYATRNDGLRSNTPATRHRSP